MNLLLGVYFGMTTILEPVFSIDSFVNDLVKYKPTHMIVSSSIWAGTLNHKKLKNKKLPYFVLPMTGGEALPEDRELEINEFLHKKQSPVQLAKGYGMCELGSAVTAAAKNFNKIGSVGIPLPKVIVSAFDIETDKELGYGERGEIRVISPGHMLGYYKNEEATQKYFKVDNNGLKWACTGDMGYVDEDGNVFICGRLNDIYINAENERVYLFDIEKVLRSSGKVQQCKVIVSNFEGKRIHVAHMVLNKENTEETLQEIKTYCLNSLSRNHIPQLVKLYDAKLPVAASGKLNVVEMEKDITNLIKL